MLSNLHLPQWRNSDSEENHIITSLSGYLWKMKRGQRVLVPQWTKRWCTIEGVNFKWYTSDVDTANCSGIIPLAAVTGIREFRSSIGGAYCFIITCPTRQMILRASSNSEMEKWIRALLFQADLSRGGSGTSIILNTNNNNTPHKVVASPTRIRASISSIGSSAAVRNRASSLEEELGRTLNKLNKLEKEVVLEGSNKSINNNANNNSNSTSNQKGGYNNSYSSNASSSSSSQQQNHSNNNRNNNTSNDEHKQMEEFYAKAFAEDDDSDSDDEDDEDNNDDDEEAKDTSREENRDKFKQQQRQQQPLMIISPTNNKNNYDNNNNNSNNNNTSQSHMQISEVVQQHSPTRSAHKRDYDLESSTDSMIDDDLVGGNNKKNAQQQQQRSINNSANSNNSSMNNDNNKTSRLNPYDDDYHRTQQQMMKENEYKQKQTMDAQEQNRLPLFDSDDEDIPEFEMVVKKPVRRNHNRARKGTRNTSKQQHDEMYENYHIEQEILLQQQQSHQLLPLYQQPPRRDTDDTYQNSNQINNNNNNHRQQSHQQQQPMSQNPRDYGEKPAQILGTRSGSSNTGVSGSGYDNRQEQQEENNKYMYSKKNNPILAATQKHDQYRVALPGTDVSMSSNYNNSNNNRGSGAGGGGGESKSSSSSNNNSPNRNNNGNATSTIVPLAQIGRKTSVNTWVGET